VLELRAFVEFLLRMTRLLRDLAAQIPLVSGGLCLNVSTQLASNTPFLCDDQDDLLRLTNDTNIPLRISSCGFDIADIRGPAFEGP
jgi:hypothetical protein